MKDIETSLRTCAVDPVTAIAKYDELWQELIDITETDVDQVIPTLRRDRRGDREDPAEAKASTRCPKVLIVGEIYVRRDDFAVDELIRMFSRRGIIAKVSGITEWIYYCDYIRKYDIKKRLRLLPWYRKPFSKELRDLRSLEDRGWYKHRVEKKVKKALAATGPHSRNAARHGADHEERGKAFRDRRALFGNIDFERRGLDGDDGGLFRHREHIALRLPDRPGDRGPLSRPGRASDGSRSSPSRSTGHPVRPAS